MQPYTVYDLVTGQIHWSGVCADDDYEHQHVPDGAGILPVSVTPGAQYVDVASGQLVDIPAQPEGWHVWDATGHVWQRLPQPEIDAALWAAVRAQRDERLRADVDSINAMRWLSMSASQQAAWQAYRQALLDVTLQPDPSAIIWPAKPE